MTSKSRPRSRSTSWVAKTVWCLGPAASILCSSTPRVRTRWSRRPSSTSGLPWSRTGAMAGAPGGAQGGRPPDADPPGLLGDGVTAFPDRPADLHPGPPGQRSLDQPVLLDEGGLFTVGIEAPPPALPPHQAHRTAPSRQVPHLHGAPSVAGRPHTAVRTPHDCCRRLDKQPPLALHLVHRQNYEPIHPQQCGRFAATFNHVPCLPFSLAW